MRVFLDANILFSASEASSATRNLLEMLVVGHELVTSPHAWEEARRNLERKRPHLLAGLDDLRRLVFISTKIAVLDRIDLVEKDQPILAAAVGARCTHLWTSDRLHFGSYYGRTVQGVEILSSTMLADLVLSA